MQEEREESETRTEERERTEDIEEAEDTERTVKAERTGMREMERKETGMEEQKTIFDYLGQVMITFGFSVVVMNVLCLLVGEEAREVSTIYSLGKEGLSVATMLQFLGVAVCITGLRFLFFTDRVIRRMSITMRTVCMLTAIVALIVLCTVLFGWFPVDMWESWAGFLLTFALCFAGSLMVMYLKEKAENRKMEEALQRIKGTEGQAAAKR